MFLTFASNKDSAIVALFVQALLMNETEPSYQAFMDQATRFANAVMRSRDEVLSLVHTSYEEEKESFVHYIGADPLLWFLTHPWDTMPGPSLAIQHHEMSRSEDALRMFMDVPFHDRFSRSEYIQRWSSTEIVFGSRFQGPLPSNIPKGLQTLELPYEYTQPMHALPDGLRNLRMSPNSEVSVDVLPPLLLRLQAGTLLVKRKNLPRQLKVLRLSHFDVPITEEDFFPAGLESCQIDYFTPFFGRLPVTKFLRLGHTPSPLSEGMFPEGISSLMMLDYNETLGERVLPDSLKTLILSAYRQPLQANVLPRGLISLTMDTFNDSLDEHVLPSSLESLKLGQFNQSLTTHVLPGSLKTLILSSYRQPLQANVLPRGLQSLTMDAFNDSLDEHVLPSSLESLKLGRFNQSLTTYDLPRELKSLTMMKYDHELEQDVLPTGLISLVMNMFDQPLNAGVLPPYLKTLQLDHFNQPLNARVLPDSLEHLDLYSFTYQMERDDLPIGLTL